MSNVDAEEIRKFSELASRWWDPSGEFRPLHDMNPLRADYIDQNSPVSDKKLIDVGCGGGILSEALAQKGAQVSGIDMGEAPLAVARLHAEDSGLKIDYQHTTAEQLASEKPGEFDVVCCLEMLEHVPDPSSVIRACAELTKSGGNLYFSTINRNPKSFLFAIVGAEYVLGLLPRGTHSYKKLIKPSELASWLREAGLELVEIRGVTMNPFTRQFSLSESDVSINYMIHARKP
jgi:2-polyprenyl-6-hydroxyphenyl methylase/3-demethylubiquinone-9 3-methyltransferase